MFTYAKVKRLSLIIQLDELSWMILNPFVLHVLQSSPSRLAKYDHYGPDQCAATGQVLNVHVRTWYESSEVL